MTRKIKLVAITCLAVFISACEVTLSADIRSGTLKDDYIAEPLNSKSQKYENALVISNMFVDHMKAGNVDSIYSKLFSEELRGLISKKNLEDILAQIANEKGEVTNYKKMQWGFITTNENGRDFVASVKIVEHERGVMKYLIVFNDDGKFEEIVGLRFKERAGVSPPGQF